MKKKVLAFTLLTSLLAINAEGQVDQKTALGETPQMVKSITNSMESIILRISVIQVRRRKQYTTSLIKTMFSES